MAMVDSGVVEVDSGLEIAVSEGDCELAAEVGGGGATIAWLVVAIC